MAGRYDLQINQGETFQKTFQWLQSDGVTPVNITGYIARCQIRNGAQHPGIIQIIPVLITDAVTGDFMLELTAFETSNIPTSGFDFSKTQQYVYDVEFINFSGAVERILNGYVYVSPEVTK